MKIQFQFHGILKCTCRAFLIFKKHHFTGQALNPPHNVNGVGRGKRRWNPAQVGCGGDMYPDYVAEAEISADLANFEAKNLKRSADYHKNSKR